MNYGPKNRQLTKWIDLYIKTSRENADKMFDLPLLAKCIVQNELIGRLEEKYKMKIHYVNVVEIKKGDDGVDTSRGREIDIDAYLKKKHGI